MIAAPDKQWLPFCKIFMGCLILLLLTVLAIVIGLGKVEQASSFGLETILGAVAVIAGQFALWAFRGPGKDDE